MDSQGAELGRGHIFWGTHSATHKRWQSDPLPLKSRSGGGKRRRWAMGTWPVAQSLLPVTRRGLCQLFPPWGYRYSRPGPMLHG